MSTDFKPPKKYKKIWAKSKKILKSGRPGDLQHSIEIVNRILGYKGNLPIDYDVVVPVAMMHDIGHSAILPEYFKYVTGPDKLVNGKLVHMLVGAKIANDVLNAVDYDQDKSKEIVEIISMHDADGLSGVDIQALYNTDNKKIFHDFDRLDRFDEKGIDGLLKFYKDKSKLLEALEGILDSFFFDELRKIAEDKLEILKK